MTQAQTAFADHADPAPPVGLPTAGRDSVLAIGRIQKAGAETAWAIAAALQTAQSRVEESDAGASSATAEGLRRQALGELLAALPGIGGEA